MKILLFGDGTLQLEFSGKELDAQIQLLKMFKPTDDAHAQQLDEVLTTLQLVRIAKK